MISIRWVIFPKVFLVTRNSWVIALSMAASFMPNYLCDKIIQSAQSYVPSFPTVMIWWKSYGNSVLYNNFPETKMKLIIFLPFPILGLILSSNFLFNFPSVYFGHWQVKHPKYQFPFKKWEWHNKTVDVNLQEVSVRINNTQSNRFLCLICPHLWT